jgi:hypothetical protein
MLADSPFQAEATALELVLHEFRTSYLKKPKVIYIDCSQLVKFIENRGEGGVPCWKGAREAYACLNKVKISEMGGTTIQICHMPRAGVTLVHNLANVARCADRSFIGCPTTQNLMYWGISREVTMEQLL